MRHEAWAVRAGWVERGLLGRPVLLGRSALRPYDMMEVPMRCSLLLTTDSLPFRLRGAGYVPLENQAIAAELAGFNAVWLTDTWLSTPPRLPDALRLIQQLTIVTDRVDLGILLRFPPAALHDRLLAELRRLDDLAGGRVCIGLDLRALSAAEQAAATALLDAIADVLDARRAPGLARRIQIIADDAAPPLAGVGGFGLLLTPDAALYARRLRLARYQAALAERPGWVARLLSLTLTNEPEATVTDRRKKPRTSALLNFTAEPALIGGPNQLVAQLAVAQIADGLDEVICALPELVARPKVGSETIERLGREVLPYLQAHPAPRKRLSG